MTHGLLINKIKKNEATEVWLCGRMLRKPWTERVTNEDALDRARASRVDEDN